MMSTHAGLPVIQVAMDQEAAPFLAAAESHTSLRTQGPAEFFRVEYDFGSALLVRTGIGLANAASAAAQSAVLFGPTALISAGSAGGVGADVRIGDVIVGTSALFHDSDATAFSYAPGQVPDMPVSYSADPTLAQAASAVEQGVLATVRCGQIVSGASFITAANIGSIRATFPQALATDMETAAIAQTAYCFEIPFTAVRAISDLCGPHAHEDFALSLDEAATVSAEAALTLLRHLSAPAL